MVRMKKRRVSGQSSLEAVLLISFMCLTLILFLLGVSRRIAEIREQGGRDMLDDVSFVVKTEFALAAVAEEGYFRIFELPTTVAGSFYTLNLTNSTIMGTNYSEVVLKYRNEYLGYESVIITPSNAFGRLKPGKNIISKLGNIIRVMPVTECGDGIDNDGNGCADMDDSGCSSAMDEEEKDGSCLVSGRITCRIEEGCDATTLLRLSSATNAHGQTSAYTSYSKPLCCRSPGIELRTSCMGPDSTVLYLSRITNAHGEAPDAPDPKYRYSHDSFRLCISSPAKHITCKSESPSCASDYDCILKLSSETNAHIASCADNNYPISICCKVTTP